MTFNVAYLVANIVGHEVARLIDPKCSEEEAVEMMKLMKENTGLELFQIMNCITICLQGRPH
jgi:hypothetical protein